MLISKYFHIFSLIFVKILSPLCILKKSYSVGKLRLSASTKRDERVCGYVLSFFFLIYTIIITVPRMGCGKHVVTIHTLLNGPVIQL